MEATVQSLSLLFSTMEIVKGSDPCPSFLLPHLPPLLLPLHLYGRQNFNNSELWMQSGSFSNPLSTPKY